MQPHAQFVPHRCHSDPWPDAAVATRSHSQGVPPRLACRSARARMGSAPPRRHTRLNQRLHQFLVTCRQIAILVQIADYQVRRQANPSGQAHRTQLPLQMVGQRAGLRQKILERGPVDTPQSWSSAETRVRDSPESSCRSRSRRRGPSPSARARSRSPRRIARARPPVPPSPRSWPPDSSTSSRTGFSTISALIISFSSSLFSASTLTICTSPGVSTWRCETRRFSFGCNNPSTSSCFSAPRPWHDTHASASPADFRQSVNLATVYTPRNIHAACRMPASAITLAPCRSNFVHVAARNINLTQPTTQRCSPAKPLIPWKTFRPGRSAAPRDRAQALPVFPHERSFPR